MTMPSTLASYSLRSRRWIGGIPALFAWVLAPLPFVGIPAPFNVVLAGVIVGPFVVAAVRLVRPPPMVRLDSEGLVFDGRRASWDELVDVELRDTLFGRRLQARLGERKWPRLFEPFVPAPLGSVVDELQARAPRELRLVVAAPTRAARVRRPLFAAFSLVVLVALATLVPVPGATFTGPADVFAVGGRLRGAQPGPGSLFVLAVSEGAASPLRLVQAALDSATDIRWRNPGSAWKALGDPVGDQRRVLAERSAVAAAAACVGQPVATTGGDVMVTGFRPLVASTAPLEPGDRVVAADGHPTPYLEDVFAAAAVHQAGEYLSLEARSPAGATHTARVPIRAYQGALVPSGVGLEPAPLTLRPPAPAATVDLRGLRGTSAGLVSALGLVDAVGSGPLAVGRRIAVTGTITPGGRVGPIGGLRFKAAAAQRAHASTLVVPAAQVDFARRYAGSMTVLGVNTLDEAARAMGGPGCRAG